MVSSSSILVAARDHVAPTLPLANYVSAPIPTIRNGEFGGAVMFGRGEFVAPGESYKIWAPHLMATFSFVDGTVLEVRALRLPDENVPVGEGVAPLDKLTPENIERHVRYCQNADEVLALAAAGNDCSSRKEQLLEQFEQCTGFGLRSYFERLFLNDVWARSGTTSA